jgi:archaeosortase A (PGF-CTERM-specific)
MPGLLSDALGWVVILSFVAGALLVDRDRDQARLVTTAAWGGFAVFWAQLVPWFAFSHKSYVEGFLSLAAVPACLYAGYLVWSGRDSLFVLSRAVAAMGLVYLPFETIPAITAFGLSLPAPEQVLIETVAAQTGFLTNLLGYTPTLIPGPQGYLNTYRFVEPNGHRLEYTVVLACTGLGSMAIFAGLIAAVRAPLDRKLRAFAVSIPIIYALNLLRVTFIGIVFGKQYMHWFVDEVLFLFGASDPYRVSFFLSDRVVSQVAAVIALVGIIYLVVRELPELLVVIEDVLYMVTGDEYDLARQLEIPRMPDGGDDVE